MENPIGGFESIHFDKFEQVNLEEGNTVEITISKDNATIAEGADLKKMEGINIKFDKEGKELQVAFSPNFAKFLQDNDKDTVKESLQKLAKSMAKIHNQGGEKLKNIQMDMDDKHGLIIDQDSAKILKDIKLIGKDQKENGDTALAKTQRSFEKIFRPGHGAAVARQQAKSKKVHEGITTRQTAMQEQLKELQAKAEKQASEENLTALQATVEQNKTALDEAINNKADKTEFETLKGKIEGENGLKSKASDADLKALQKATEAKFTELQAFLSKHFAPGRVGKPKGQKQA